MKDTQIPMKYKALIVLSTAAFLRDRYVLHAAREFALEVGVSTEEIQEALAIAGDTAFGSTWLNGYRFDFDTFKKELSQMLNWMKKMETIPPRG